MKRVLSKVPLYLFLSLVLFITTTLALPAMPAQAAESNPECWAVIIGIADYKYLGDAPNCDNDARELSQILSPVWGESHIKLLLNSQATKANILAAIDWLAEKADANDTVLFYFSGTGPTFYYQMYWDDTSGKWILEGIFSAYDSFLQSIPSIGYYTMGNSIDSKKLMDSFKLVKAEKSTIILDTTWAENFKYSLEKNGRVMMMASKSDENTYGAVSLQHSVFTYYILQAFEKFSDVDANHDYELSVEEIFQYAGPLTSQYEQNQNFQSIQHPVISDNLTEELALLAKFVFTPNTGLPTGTNLVTLDGVNYTSPPEPILEIPGSTHTVNVPQLINKGSDTRFVFTKWSDGDTSATRVVSKGSYTPNYNTEYLLTVESAYGNPTGLGWYKAGSTADFSVTPIIETSDTKHIFTGWSGDFTGADSSASLAMSSPKKVAANWRNEYLLTVNSEYGQPSGAGWYQEGESTRVAVEPVQGFIIRHIFTGWSGDLNNAQSNAGVSINSPKIITATWRTDYVQLYYLIGGVVVLVAAVIVTVVLIRRRSVTV
ncbi:MAG: caspase family protein [Dehalococcoidales bacterium]